MKLDPALHKTLLAGLSRAPLAPGAGSPAALHPLLAAVPDALRFWHTFAATDLWQRAGYQPAPPAQPAQLPCEAEATCPRAAEQVLHLILRDIHPELLDSWLMQAQARSMSLPHSALVPLLDLSIQKAALRPVLTTLLGARGRWLAAQQPRWAELYGSLGQLTADSTAQHWQLGTLQQRCLALQTMRRADAPAALLALEQDWAQEPAENRIALLPCLATGLGLHDEDFLERGLDDKRKEVRAAAQQLLATLPGSQLRERCKARLEALFTLERKSGLAARLGAMLAGGSLPQLSLQLPDACDKAMKRDGIGVQAHHGLGEKAGWLLDMMRCVPPMHWSAAWQLTPEQVIAVLAGQEFKTALLTGLVHAASRAVQANPGSDAIAWFVALLGEQSQAASGFSVAQILLPDLEHLPVQEQERIVRQWLDQAGSDRQAYSFALSWAEQGARRAPQPLSPAMSRLLLLGTQRLMATSQPSYGTRSDFAVLGKVLDCEDISYARANWPAEHWEHWPHWRSLVDDLMETLQFRHTMHASFLENDA